MKINNLYEVKIYPTSSTNIEINNIATVNIKVVDFNNNPITNKNITVKCDKGFFQNWSNYDSDIDDIHELNNVKTFTGTTDDKGWFDCTYYASEWGLCTLSCDVEKLQFFVGGFKQLTVSSKNNWDCIFQVNEATRHCRLRWYYNNSSLTLVNETKTIDTITLPKTEYYPVTDITKATYNPRVGIRFAPNGDIKMRTMYSYSTTMANHYEYFEWHY